MDRRLFLQLGTGAMALGAPRACAGAEGPEAAGASDRTASFRHSVTRWPFGKLSVDELARAAKGLGIAVGGAARADEWATLRRTASRARWATRRPATRHAPHGGLEPAANHAWLVPGYERGSRSRRRRACPT
jgi:hypothetical protein